MTIMNNNVYEEKIGKMIFIVEARNLDKGNESAEEKLRNIMVKELIAKDNTMVS